MIDDEACVEHPGMTPAFCSVCLDAADSRGKKAEARVKLLEGWLRAIVNNARDEGRADMRDSVDEQLIEEARALLDGRAPSVSEAVRLLEECERDGQRMARGERASDARPDEHRGLYGKYRVERRDGSSGPGGKHAQCEYFVLDLAHDKHAFQALMAYADSCADEFPELAADLRRRAVGERSDELAREQRSNEASPRCLAASRIGYDCELAEGHVGQHVSTDLDGKSKVGWGDDHPSAYRRMSDAPPSPSLSEKLETYITLVDLRIDGISERLRAIETAPLRLAPTKRPTPTELCNRVIQLLVEHKGNITQAASAIGVRRSQMQRWVKRFGLQAMVQQR